MAVSVLVHFCFTNFALCHIWLQVVLARRGKILSSPTLPSIAKLVSPPLARQEKVKILETRKFTGFGAAQYLECCASPFAFHTM